MLNILFVREKTAARILDMPIQMFRELVNNKALPGPCNHDRWDVEQLQAIMRGDTPRLAEKLDL